MGLLKKKAAAVIRMPCQLKNGLVLDLSAGTSEFNCNGVEGMKGMVWKTEKGKCISDGVAFGGFENRMNPLLIRKKKICLKLQCLTVLAANMTTRLYNES